MSPGPPGPDCNRFSKGCCSQGCFTAVTFEKPVFTLPLVLRSLWGGKPLALIWRMMRFPPN